MNDFSFGNKIFDLRTSFKLSQSQLAEMVGVTNKAVSKWENGKSKPTTNVIRKLAAVFHTDIDECCFFNTGNNRKRNRPYN